MVAEQRGDMRQATAQAVAAQIQQTMCSSQDLLKPRVFDISDAARPQCSWRMEAAATHLGRENVFQLAGTQRPETVEGLSSMDEHIRRYAKILYGTAQHLDKALALMSMEDCKSVPTLMVQEAEGEQNQGELLRPPTRAAKFKSWRRANKN